MSPHDVKAITDAMLVISHFSFFDGIAWSLGLIKFIEFLFQFFDFFMPRLKRILMRFKCYLIRAS